MKDPNYQTIYLDSHATTRVDQEVLEKMLPFFTEHYGNGNHKAGWKANVAMEEARHQVAHAIKARPTEIIFTSGATEAINMAVFGLANSGDQQRKHIITQVTEHSAVLRCIDQLEARDFRITRLGVDALGRIDINELKAAINEETLLVAIMLANNEIGTIQPIEKIGKICREKGVRFFCDLTQGLGWHPIDVDKMNIDLAAMSAHKIYGPRGVGALFVRRKGKKVRLNPILVGGGQERGLRPGTANIPGIVGFGRAVEIQVQNAGAITAKISSLRNQLQSYLFANIEGIKLNGCPIDRHPGNLNLAIPNVSGEDLIGALPCLTFSTGSACTGSTSKPSYVIAALGVDKAVLKNTFRLGIGKYNTPAEMDFVGRKIVETVQKLQDKRRKSLIFGNKIGMATKRQDIIN